MGEVGSRDQDAASGEHGSPQGWSEHRIDRDAMLKSIIDGDYFFQAPLAGRLG
ncbi:MAG: hypothetical protein U0905_14380 [Pirellulales bacterium]